MLAFVVSFHRVLRSVTYTMPLTRSKVKREQYVSASAGINPVVTGAPRGELFPKRRKVEPLAGNHLQVKRERIPVIKNEAEIIRRTHQVASNTEPGYDPNSKSSVYARIRVRPQESDVVPDIEDAPPTPPSPPSPREAFEVLQRLRKFYRGELSTASHPKTKRRTDLLDSLFATILSQATSNTNSSRAFAALKHKFSSWEDAMSAGAEAIEEQIRCGGLAKAKSKVMHSILTQLYEQRGSCSLEFLWQMSTEQVKQTLCSFNGVGPKTASCVLMFGMQRGEFPVDTHIRRIAARLGWMADKSSAEKTYEVLNECLQEEIKYELHVLLIEHGRKTCKARSPRCQGCPLANICPSRLASSSDC